MKKLVVLFCLCLWIVSAAFTAGELNKTIKDACTEVQNVKDAQVIVLGDSSVIALKTAPLFMKTEYNTLEATIRLYMKENHSEITNLYFSYDVDVFLKTSALSVRIEKDKSALLYKDEIFALIHLIESRKSSRIILAAGPEKTIL